MTTQPRLNHYRIGGIIYDCAVRIETIMLNGGSKGVPILKLPGYMRQALIAKYAEERKDILDYNKQNGWYVTPNWRNTYKERFEK